MNHIDFTKSFSIKVLLLDRRGVVFDDIRGNIITHATFYHDLIVYHSVKVMVTYPKTVCSGSCHLMENRVDVLVP